MIAPVVSRLRGIALVIAVLAAGAGAHAARAAERCLPLLSCPATPAAQPGSAAVDAPPPGPPLDIGLTEGDTRLYAMEGPTWRAAAKVIALQPRYVRVLVPWERIQPRAGRKPNWDAPPFGCPVRRPDCDGPRSVRAQLQAIKRRQDADGGGWNVVVVPFFTPSWAVAATGRPGCQKPDAPARAQMPRLAAYRTFLRGLQGLGDKIGIELAYWMPWNEPNHPSFLNPQRATCDVTADATAPALYARLVRAMRAELRDDQQLVLGSLAGLEAPRVHAASAAEFAGALPRDVACLDAPFAQHLYVGRHGSATSTTRAARLIVDDLDSALRARGCSKQLWISETGTFDRSCATMADALSLWARDPRVDAAFQYTFRDAPDFPVGLVSTSLRVTYRSYRAWYAFATARGSSPPARPCATPAR